MRCSLPFEVTPICITSSQITGTVIQNHTNSQTIPPRHLPVEPSTQPMISSNQRTIELPVIVPVSPHLRAEEALRWELLERMTCYQTIFGTFNLIRRGWAKAALICATKNTLDLRMRCEYKQIYIVYFDISCPWYVVDAKHNMHILYLQISADIRSRFSFQVGILLILFKCHSHECVASGRHTAAAAVTDRRTDGQWFLQIITFY